MANAPPSARNAAVRVAVDGRALRPGAARARGIARYLRSVLEELVRCFPGDEYVVVVPGGAAEPAPAGTVVAPRLPGRVVFAAAALTGRPRLDSLAGGCDVAWIPAPAPVAVAPGTPLVLTVHDLSFEHAPNEYSRYDRLWHRLARPRALATGAARVLCVSGAVERDAIEAWRLPESLTLVVRPGGGRPPGPPGPLPAGLPDRFVLAVGALEPRKRPLLLAEAHRRARQEGLEAGLVFAGHGRERLERGGATVLGPVADDVADALHTRALALACVSREEGFGFTPVEALARGVPPVVADLPVFAETVGEGALRVPPGDPEALAAALLRLEREPDLRERIVAAGREAIASLSWETAARGTRAALAEAAR
jgi:glycosyltransferase involved in cell wall biosynthesis